MIFDSFETSNCLCDRIKMLGIIFGSRNSRIELESKKKSLGFLSILGKIGRVFGFNQVFSDRGLIRKMLLS